MLRIDWRLPAAYRHTRQLPASGFAWEYLRRNEDYRHDFEALTRSRRQDAKRLETFAQRWGLRFPKRSRRAG